MSDKVTVAIPTEVIRPQLTTRQRLMAMNVGDHLSFDAKNWRSISVMASHVRKASGRDFSLRRVTEGDTKILKVVRLQ